MTDDARNATSGKRGRGGAERFLLGGVGVVVPLVVWELLVRLGLVSSVLISSPVEVAAAAESEVRRGTMWETVAPSLYVWTVGFGIAVVVGIGLGLIGGWYRRAGYVVDPWLNVLYAVPHLALIPLFILWFGLGYGFRIFLVFLSSVFYVAVNTLAGVRSTERRLIDVAVTYGAGRMRTFRTLVLPGSLPHIVTGVRLGASRAVVGVVVAEFIGANSGVGFMITLAGATLDTARLMFGIVLLGAFGILIGELLRCFERRLETWRES